MPSLLVLAAGMGSRYGGLKQIEPVGPSGETLLDYSVYDALRAGFKRVVFVVRRDFERQFRERVASRYAGRAPVELAFQSLDQLGPGLAPPPGRTKPWGTAHAVWCARDRLAGPFAAINADDFYGADAFRRLARFLADGEMKEVGTALRAVLANSTEGRAPPAVPRFALVGYRLGGTLSEHGTVARGLCAVDAGRLRSIEEVTSIAASDVGPGRRFTGEEIVSMNCWGFTPAFWPLLEAEWRAFLAGHAGSDTAECYLPSAVSHAVDRGAASVEVLPTTGSWFGVTHREDRAKAAAALADLVRRGDYPSKLF